MSKQLPATVERRFDNLTLVELAKIDPRSLSLEDSWSYRLAHQKRVDESRAQMFAEDAKAWDFELEEYVDLPESNGQRLVPGRKVFASFGRDGRWYGPYTVVQYRDLMLAVRHPEREPTATETLCQRLPDPFNNYRVVG